MIGTVGDPATPYDGAVAMADQLDSGVLSIWKAKGTPLSAKTEFITAAVVGYLVHLVISAGDTTCPA